MLDHTTSAPPQGSQPPQTEPPSARYQLEGPNVLSPLFNHPFGHGVGLAAVGWPAAAQTTETELLQEILEALQAEHQAADLHRAYESLAGGFGRAEHLEILLRNDVELQGLVAPDAYLPGVDLTGQDLSRATLTNAHLFHAQMQGANLSWAQMEGAGLFGAQMEGQTSLGRGWRGRSSAVRRWRGQTSAGRRWRGWASPMRR